MSRAHTASSARERNHPHAHGIHRSAATIYPYQLLRVRNNSGKDSGNNFGNATSLRTLPNPVVAAQCSEKINLRASHPIAATPTGKDSGNTSGNIGNTPGNNLSPSPHRANQHAAPRSLSAQADFAAERSEAFRRGFNCQLLLPYLVSPYPIQRMIYMSGSGGCPTIPVFPWRPTHMITITLYSKAGCHLCDEARNYLEELAADHEIDIQEIDIRRDPAIFERYRYRIPVILVDGTERLEGRIEQDDVFALLPPTPEPERQSRQTRYSS